MKNEIEILEENEEKWIKIKDIKKLLKFIAENIEKVMEKKE